MELTRTEQNRLDGRQHQATLRNSGEIARISHARCLTPRRVTIRLDCQKRKVSLALRWKGSFVSRLEQEPIGRRKLYSHQYPFQRRLDIVKDQDHQLRLSDLPESRSHATETEYLGAICHDKSPVLNECK